MSTEMPTDTSRDALRHAAGPEPDAPRGGGRMTRGAWVAVVCTIACCGVMAAVLVMAQDDGKGDAARPPRADGARSGDPLEVFGPSGVARGDRQAQSAARIGGCGPLDPENPPELEVQLPEGILDLARLKQGVTVEHDVTFKSVGKSALCIGKVTTGCGCLKVSLVGEKKRFEPGESGTIRVVADTTGRVGTINKQVSILCNDAKNPRRSFRVKMDISDGLMSEPRYLQFGNVPPKTPATRTLILRSAIEEKPWKVLKVESARRIAGRDPAVYTYEVEPVTDPRFHKIKLSITHPGYEQLGAVSDIVAITTDHPERPRIEVRGHIHVVPRIRSRSRIISLGYVQTGVPRAPTRARIQAGAVGVDFKITKVEVKPKSGSAVSRMGPGFKADFGRDQRGWWVDVSYDGKSRGPGLLQAVLIVHTDDEQQPLLKIPVRATIRKTK